MSTFEEDPSAQRQIWTPATSSGATLKTVSLAVDNGPIGRGGSGAHYVTGADGGRWVMKATLFGGQAHRYLYLNEALSAQVAWRLGVRAPEIAIMELSSDQLKTFSSTASDSARFVLASHLIEPAEPLSPDTANSQTREARAGITVLDAIVWNTDRNPEHVLASRSRESEWDLWAIDHGHTFATADTIVGHLDPTAPMPGSQPLLASGITSSDLEPWIETAEGVRRKEFYEMAAGLPAAWVVEPDAPDALADALVARVKEVASALPGSLSSA